MVTNSEQMLAVIAYGTRPEAIKLAPVVRELMGNTQIEPMIVVSGQHREMLDQVNRLFKISPDLDLDIFKPGQTLTDITNQALAGYSRFLDGQPADVVIVQGDTTTTFAAALAAFYHQIPVVHVEAGLRTDDPRAPFPEEINRRLTTQVATLHLAPTPLNRSNLLRDGVPDAAIRVTGNTVIDAFLDVSARKNPIGEPRIDVAIAAGRRIVLVTAHRRETWGPPMKDIGRALAEIASSYPEVFIVIPAHRNPLVREQLLPLLTGFENVAITEPLDYGAFSTLLAASTVVLTDSGGIQEEAPSLGKPVLVMRDTTERPEGVTAGTVALVGTDPRIIVDMTAELLFNDDAYGAMAQAINPYGDGRAAARSVAAIESLLGLGDPLPDFDPAEVAQTPR